MKKIILLLSLSFLFLSSNIYSQNCANYTLNMYDSWGDGWNGATYTLSGNSTLGGATTGTLNFGTSGVNTFSVTGGSPCLTGGGVVTMNWNNGIPAASFTIANNNSMNPIGTFNWTPTTADIAGSPYFFTVNILLAKCYRVPVNIRGIIIS